MARDEYEYDDDDEDDDEFDDFADEWDNPDDDDDDGEYESDESYYDGGADDLSPLDPARDTSDDDNVDPEWWQDGMPADWWDYYDDDYEIEEFEIAIDY